MLRRMTYRSAATAFVFTGLWFVFGLVLLWTPVPHALGIRGQLFTAWVILFFVILAGAGATLFVAAVNGIFPPNVRPPARAERLGASPKDGPAPSLPQPPHAGGAQRRGPANTRGG